MADQPNCLLCRDRGWYSNGSERFRCHCPAATDPPPVPGR